MVGAWTSPLWRIRDLRLIMVGTTLNAVGSQISVVALPLAVYASTNDATVVGYVAAAELVVIAALSYVGGHIVDRLDRRKVMLAAATLAAVTSACLGLVLWSDSASATWFVGYAVLSAAAFCFFSPANFAATRAVVPEPLLPNAAALEETRRGVGALVGPTIGGVLFGLQRALPFFAEAVSFLVMALCSLAIRSNLNPKSDPDLIDGDASATSAAGPTWRALLSRQLWPVVVVFMVANFAVSGFILAVMLVLQRDETPAKFIGLIPAAVALAQILGSTVSPRIIRRWTPRVVIPVGCVALGVAMAATSAAVGLPIIVCCIVFLGWLPSPIVHNSALVHVLRSVQTDHIGRVAGSLTTVTMVSAPLAPILVGAALEHGWITACLIGVGLATALSGFFALVLPTSSADLPDALSDPRRS